MHRKFLVIVSGCAVALVGSWTLRLVAPPVAAGAAATVPAGYVTSGGARVYDSRGTDGAAPRLAGGTIVTINAGHPGASAVGVNITLTDTSGPGYVAAWADGPWPGTSIINSSVAGETVANFAIVPVAADGTFQLLTQRPAHLIVDVFGYMAGGSTPLVPATLSATITGYGPAATLTEVSGTVSNGTSITRNVRADVRCPNGTVKTDLVFGLPAGETRGFSVLCDTAFTTGATVTVVEV